MLCSSDHDEIQANAQPLALVAPKQPCKTMLSALQAALEDTATVSKAVFADWSLIGLCICFFFGTLSVSFLPFMIRYRDEYQVSKGWVG